MTRGCSAGKQPRFTDNALASADYCNCAVRDVHLRGALARFTEMSYAADMNDACNNRCDMLRAELAVGWLCVWSVGI